jgi:O-antigen/teichoic acid export membrane protein
VDIARALTYIFEDEEWIPKLAIAVALVFAGIVLLPVFLVGLAAWALLLGYLVELVRNLRDQHPTPLPRWDHYTEKFSEGSRVLTAALVYNLPNLLVLCCVGAVPLVLGRDSATGGISLLVLCCLGPFILIYNLLSGAMLALGTARFADEGNIVVFFQFSDLFAALTRSPQQTLMWLILATVVNIGLGLVGILPCLGWFGVPAVGIMVQGHLLAQFANRVETPYARRKMKPKRG